jgi:hypothetical protein
MFYAPPGSNEGEPVPQFIGPPGLPQGNYAVVSPSTPRNPGGIALDRQILVEGTPTDVHTSAYNSADWLQIACGDYISAARGNMGLLPFFDLNGDQTTRAAYVLKFEWRGSGDDEGVHAIISWTQAGMDSGCKFLIPHVNAGVVDEAGNLGRVQGMPLCCGSLVKEANAKASALAGLVAKAKEIAADERIPVSKAMDAACSDNRLYMEYRRRVHLGKR